MYERFPWGYCTRSFSDRVHFSDRRLYFMLMRIVSSCDPKHEPLWDDMSPKDRKCHRKYDDPYLGAGATGETWGTSSTKGTLGRSTEDMTSDRCNIGQSSH